MGRLPSARLACFGTPLEPSPTPNSTDIMQSAASIVFMVFCTLVDSVASLRVNVSAAAVSFTAGAPSNLNAKCQTPGADCENGLICNEGFFSNTCMYKLGKTCTRATMGTNCASSPYGWDTKCHKEELTCCIRKAPTLCSKNCAPYHAVQHGEEHHCCSGMISSQGDESIEMTEWKKENKWVYGFCA